MRGRNIFTQSEANEIRGLIALKVNAPTNEQKVLREEIRNIGFYYSDFRSRRSKGGYTVDDFNELISFREIAII